MRVRDLKPDPNRVSRSILCFVLAAMVPPAGAFGAAPNPAKASRSIEFKLPPTPPPSSETDGAVYPEGFPRPVAEWLEAQIALARNGISCGQIDGVGGPQTAAALRAFQEREELDPTGTLDPPTRERLVLNSEPLTQIALTPDDIARVQPLSPTWLGKSQQTALDYETTLELVAERAHASPTLIKRLNPAVDWTAPEAGLPITVPAVGLLSVPGRAAHLHIRLAEHLLQVRDADGRLLAHFPVSIARDVEKRPEGELRVTVVIPNPDYTFNPEVFPESEEGRELGRKLVLPPGPNNPVGVAWFGLDRPGYGIHGTPRPEQVGRTESHGCFRLANWDARTLLEIAWVGLPVLVDP